MAIRVPCLNCYYESYESRYYNTDCQVWREKHEKSRFPASEDGLAVTVQIPLGSLRLLLIRPAHRLYGCLYVLVPPPLMRSPQTSGYSRSFTNFLYLIRMPLGFFTFSSPDEPVTLSPVFLAQYYPSEIPIFDAKPPIFEAVTLYLPPLFFCKRPSDRALRHTLNVTASYISPSVK
mgnify:CR=1 FL=1